MMGERARTLLAELEARHDEFISALKRLGPDPAEVAVIADWDARDMVVHVGFWAGHGADALELAASGRGAEFSYDKSQTDAMNADTARAGHVLAFDLALEQEAAAYARLRGGLLAVDDDRLDELLGNGDSLEDVIRYDGPDHYAEHAAHLALARLSEV